MKNSRNRILKITTTAVMIALTCVLTAAVSIPTPTKGYLNLGDCAVLLSGWLLGPVLGPVAGGVGAALADLMVGYPVYVPGTLVIKGVMAFIAALAPCRFSENGKKHPGIGFILCAVFAEAFMTAGYWLYEAVVIGEGFAAAFAGVSGNVVQGCAGAAGAYFLAGILRCAELPGTCIAGSDGKGRIK
jgi:uncharacterized membrane protein